MSPESVMRDAPSAPFATAPSRRGGALACDLSGRRFRAARHYTLVPHERLDPGDQASLAAATGDPDFYGILRPTTDGSTSIKQVDTNTALLLHTLDRPGPIPSFVRARLLDQWQIAIAELVLEGLIELEVDGDFVTGAAAHPLLFTSAPEPDAGNHLTRLSMAALRHAQAIDVDDVTFLASALYLYNKIPVSPRWRRAIRDTDAVRRLLGVGDDGPLAQTLQQHWRSRAQPATNDGWLSWYAAQGRPPERTAQTYKLYVSPRPEQVADAFRVCVEIATEMRTPVFKIGNDVHGLLRCDKLVLYCWEEDEMMALGAALSAALRGLQAQGVPFTAALDDDGIVSWGVDPRPDPNRPEWLGAESWRMWIVRRLASALVAARRAGPDAPTPWRYALERLRLDGVDTDTWAPIDGQSVDSFANEVGAR